MIAEPTQISSPRSKPMVRAPFAPAWMDDLGLSCQELRVLFHLWRRANGDRQCWPAAASIQKACRLNKDTIWAALKELEHRGLVSREKTFRNANRYTLLLPQSVGGNEGATDTSGVGGNERPRWRKRGGNTLAEKEGCKGSPRKVPHRKEGASSHAALALDPESIAAIAEEFATSGDRIRNALRIFNDVKEAWPDDPRTESAFKGWLRTSRDARGVLRAEPLRLKPRPSESVPLSEPPGWRETLPADDDDRMTFAQSEWSSIPEFYCRRIIKKMTADQMQSSGRSGVDQY